MTQDNIDCIIYRSRIKDGMYLYLAANKPYSELPDNVLQGMGREPEEAMRLTLSLERKLARADITQVMENLRERGFHLQMPPRAEYLANWDNDKLGLRGREAE
ncbi:MAG TPA: YcgL domain-containing protein [bacterium]|nr:YcgL domain-containing protein [bacterium]